MHLQLLPVLEAVIEGQSVLGFLERDLCRQYLGVIGAGEPEVVPQSSTAFHIASFVGLDELLCLFLKVLDGWIRGQTTWHDDLPFSAIGGTPRICKQGQRKGPICML